MPSKMNKGKAAQARPRIPKELYDQFVNGPGECRLHGLKESAH